MPKVVHPTLNGLDLVTGFETAGAAGADPLDGILMGGDETGFGTPSDDELPCATTAGDAVNDDRFTSRVVLVHEAEEALHLGIGRHAVVGHVDVVVSEVGRHILAIVELAAVHDGPDAVVVIEVEDIRIGPPGGGDDVRHDPSEGLGAMRLAFSGPIPGANG